ncbi:MAG: mechanosensitive ion channel domain-containing protein, partial [Rhodospirillaceae bacterium]
NEIGGVVGSPVKIVPFDTGPVGRAGGDVAEAVALAAADPQVFAAIGPWAGDQADQARAALEEAGLVGLSPQPFSTAVEPGEYSFSKSIGLPGVDEARFLANYSRNVEENIFLTIISQPNYLQEELIKPFAGVYERFGTPVRGTLTLSPDPEGLDNRIDRMLERIEAKADSGALLLALEPDLGARFLAKLRAKRMTNAVVAPSTYATTAFTEALIAHAGDPLLATDYANDVLVSSPLLLDIASQTAQSVKAAYQESFGDAPDWIATFGYEVSSLLAKTLAEVRPEGGGGETAGLRGRIREQLTSYDSPEDAVDSLSGPVWFNSRGEAKKPVRIGRYNGLDLVAALTQLQPIERRGDIDYIEELKEGRLLYVNDRFMYRTNVVYTGITLHNIEEVDADAGTVVLDFSMWFRYRGNFSPETVTFLNVADGAVSVGPDADDGEEGQPPAAQPRTTPTQSVTLEVLETDGDDSYALYRVKAPFFMDFRDTRERYGVRLAGVSMRHASLDRNNLLYVGDVLGMGLGESESLAETLREDRILAPGIDWTIDSAWFSQEMFLDSTFGKPTYVGYGASQPIFSRIELGVLLDRGEFDLISLIPNEYFIYLLVFSVLGAIFAVAMDHRKWGRYWYVQSFGLRLVFWPGMLLAAGGVVLEFANERLEPAQMDLLVQIYKSLWWLVPARLAGIAMERFVWWPIENRTKRAIPNLIRLFAQFVFYTLAVFGIIAFVYDQKLTSLLATGGLLTMIVGLAIQANISNVFSGIFLNVERPFGIGDWIQIDDSQEGVVTDMTWRTTRIRTRAGYTLSIPNGQVSDARINNYSADKQTRIEVEFKLRPDADPRIVNPLIEEALPQIEGVSPDPVANVRFIGLTFEYDWLALYEVQFWIKDYGNLEDIQEAVITHVLEVLQQHGVTPWTPPKDRSGILAGPGGRGPDKDSLNLRPEREALPGPSSSGV